MGGFGSGFQGTAKATTRERHALHVKDWGNLPPGARANWTITLGGGQDVGAVHVRVEADALALTYTPPNGTPRQQSIAIERAPCRFGGSRPWFLCPECGRRCGALYRGRGGFYCRDCAGLNYPSTRETPDTRAVHKADRIRARLGWPAGIAFGHGPKPKGMHWRTFWRLVAEHDRHADAFTAGNWARLEKAHERLQRVTGV